MSDFNTRYLSFCKPFIDAIREVYSTMVTKELKAGSPVFKEQSGNYADYSALMGINGTLKNEEDDLQFKGSLVISWPLQTYLNTASTMLGEEYKEINDEIEDVGMEICNITMGNAKKILNPLGYKIEMSIPNLISGDHHRVKSEDGVKTIVIPFTSDIGDLFIELNYKDSE